MIQKSTVLLYVPEMMEMPAGRTTGACSGLPAKKAKKRACGDVATSVGEIVLSDDDG